MRFLAAIAAAACLWAAAAAQAQAQPTTETGCLIAGGRWTGRACVDVPTPTVTPAPSPTAAPTPTPTPGVLPGDDVAPDVTLSQEQARVVAAFFQSLATFMRLYPDGHNRLAAFAECWRAAMEAKP